MKSLKELYNLSYDESGFESGLIRWYNKVINKSVDELKITDVAKMIRQNILLDIAIKQAIELFFLAPYNGEYQNGDILSLLVTLDLSQIDNDKLKKLKIFIQELKNKYAYFDWENEKSKDKYAEELDVLEMNAINLII